MPGLLVIYTGTAVCSIRDMHGTTRHFSRRVADIPFAYAGSTTPASNTRVGRPAGNATFANQLECQLAAASRIQLKAVTHSAAAKQNAARPALGLWIAHEIVNIETTHTASTQRERQKTAIPCLLYSGTKTPVTAIADMTHSA